MGFSRTGLFVRRSVNGLFAVEDMAKTTGKRFFVHSGTGTDAGGRGTGPDLPLATLNYAVGLCTASKGDIIYVMPGHSEIIGTATALIMDKIGVRVIGLGTGRLKPQFSIAVATTATWNITAANCSVENVDITTNFLDVAAAMTVDAAADGLTLQNVNFFDTSAVLGALVGITIAAGCDDITIENCKYYGIALTGPATDAILCAGAVNRLRVTDCFFKGEFSNGTITASAAASTNVLFNRVYLYNLSTTGKGINLHASTTGAAGIVQAYLADNVAGEFAITGAALFMTDRVRQSNVITASSFLTLGADS